MDLATVRKTSSLPTGLLASIAVHLLAILFLVVTFSHTQPLDPPVNLANAISISMEQYRPKPPKPPKEPPKPQAPKNVVTSTAPEPEETIAEAPAEPSPPAEQQEESAPSSAAASYASIVAGILQRNKRYPRDALLSSQEGTVRAYFVVNAQGRVIGYRIEESSGISSLDGEVLSLLRRVRFPPIPNDGGDPQRREFTLPLVFKIEQ